MSPLIRSLIAGNERLYVKRGGPPLNRVPVQSAGVNDNALPSVSQMAFNTNTKLAHDPLCRASGNLWGRIFRIHFCSVCQFRVSAPMCHQFRDVYICRLYIDI